MHMNNRKIGQCVRCLQEKPIVGRGLCQTCYARAKRTGVLTEYSKTTKRGKELVVGKCQNCDQLADLYARGLCAQCYRKQYYQSIQKDKHAEEMRRARAKNPDIYKAIDKRRHEKDMEKRNEACRIYYGKNSERLRAYQSKWRKANPLKRDEYKRKRRAKAIGLPNTLTLLEWEEILRRYNYSCAYCGATEIPLVREHKIPAARGGGYTAENIVPACASCNSCKGTLTHDEFMNRRHDGESQSQNDSEGTQLPQGRGRHQTRY